MCCLVIFGFFILFFCVYSLHTISPYHYCRGVVHFAVPRPHHWLPALITPTPTPPGQPIARYFPPVTHSPPPPMSQAWQRVGWEDGTTSGGRGHWGWSRGSAALTLGPLSSLRVLHRITPTLSIPDSHSYVTWKKLFAAKKIFQQMGKYSRTIHYPFQSRVTWNPS